ncbi:acylphosphatase [Fulvimarina sp. 2208YS6-2-32]|uniref:Acylphosphatase n=1 Tax=Fulvimarina uroteuthidis TaxID=3098149 RepID=A0ABU5I2L7_9HYPH|nr:acylphosphatase [Fulvimarina sp. 2208YS6-2-32]MDY8109580.1 acylphosphatase [Fulvimarina sp. 2208YS6-2-32]
MPDSTMHVIVHGRVQGVGFRDWTERTARSRGLAGWCRNRSDGTVEVVAAGDGEALSGFLFDLERGPSHARVESVEIIANRVEGDMPHAFEIRPTR